MRIKRPYWLLLGVLICLNGCSPTHLPASDTQRPPGPIPTPPDAPAEPTFKPSVPPHVPPRFMSDDRPLQPLNARNTLTLAACGSATKADSTGAGVGDGWCGRRRMEAPRPPSLEALEALQARLVAMAATEASEGGGACIAE